MNLTMQPPSSYPFYMSSPRLPYTVPWSSNPFRFPPPSQPHFPPVLLPLAYPLPFILSQQQQQQRPNFPPKNLHSFSSYTNTRYNHLKQSTSHINRHRTIDTSLHSQHSPNPNYQYRPSKTKSVSDFQQLSHQNSIPLPKAHSWHSLGNLSQPNLPVNYAKEMHSIHEHPPHHRPTKKKKKSDKKYLSSSPKQNQSPPEHGIVRISTLDELPIINNPIYQKSLSNSSKTQEIKRPTRMNSNKRSSPSCSSSCSNSRSSFQERLNGSLRNDPLLIAAMEDFQELRRTSSRSTSLTPHHRDLSRDSLCSDSTHRSSSSSSSSSSRSHSQSSFTSLERLEIRRLIQTLKTKGIQSFNIPFQLSPISAPSNEQSLTKQPPSSSAAAPINKQKKSSITEELDREFNSLRAINPNNELVYVKPSLIKKGKNSIPPLPTLEELIHKLQAVDTSTLKQVEEKTYENPIFTVPVPQTSPIPPFEIKINEDKLSETKPEYAIPIKKLPEVNLRSSKKDEQIRSFSFCKPMNDIIHETRQTRPISMFNWLHCGLTNPFPTTFQPNRTTNNENEYDKSLVKENIYASDIDVHLPLANDKDYLNNQIIMTDYLSDYKQTTNNSSILNDFSRLFTRFGNNKQEQKSKLKTKLNKNNHLRCSIM